MSDAEELTNTERPYPEGVAWDEAWRQRQRADQLEAELKYLESALQLERNYISQVHKREGRLKGILSRIASLMNDISFNVGRDTDVNEFNIERKFRELAEISGSRWKGVDPDEFVNELRRD